MEVDRMRTPATPPGAGPVPTGMVGASVVGSRAIDEELIEVVCDDPDLLAAEFDAIIAAEWPTPPVDSRRQATACGRPDKGTAGVYGDRRGPASRPHHPGIGGWARQRSPPRFRNTYRCRERR
jgi:hypothetical protein